MDHAERQRLKQLANDSIIATFGYDTNEARLAQALEGAVEEFEFIATGCDHCKTCPTHGSYQDDAIPIDADEILRIHSQLKKQVQALRDYHVRLSTELADEFPDLLLTDELAELIEGTESYVDELEAETLP